MLPRVATLNVEILWLTSVPVDWPSHHSFSQSAPRENLPYGAIASFDENQVVMIGANEENCGFCGTTTSASVRVRVHALALSFLQKPRNRGAQFRDAGPVVGRGGQYGRKGGRTLGERGLDLGDALAKLGRL